MFQDPYKVLDFKHPNVKIEREREGEDFLGSLRSL